jgi:signal transduction histidine kinase
MKNNIFQKARIKLTLYYIGIMAVILIAFSSVLIYTIESKIRHGFRDQIVITENENDPVSNTSDEIEMLIYVVDGFLLLIIGFSSYFLAGKTLKPIKEALDSQKKFSADASHDLRTPIAIIMTESEVALKNGKNSEKELTTVIQSNLEEAKKMSRLVNDLLLISRGENQAMRHSFIEIDIHNFIEKLVNKIKPQAENKGLEIKLCEYKKILIRVDTDNFERAISNILQNAINYTKVGGVTVDIKEDSQRVYITISDTGVGIAPKDLPFVFDRFYKASHSRNDKSGSGLGLPISKLIIEEHKGKISLDSKVGIGTEVVISLPVIIT